MKTLNYLDHLFQPLDSLEELVILLPQDDELVCLSAHEMLN